MYVIVMQSGVEASVRWLVHEARGLVGQVRWVRPARVGKSCFVLPFSFGAFLLGKQKKSG